MQTLQLRQREYLLRISRAMTVRQDLPSLLRLYVTYLRQKIEPDPSNPRDIFNERGVGYRFMDFQRGGRAPSAYSETWQTVSS